MRILLVNPAKRFKGFLGKTRSLQPTVLPNSLLYIGAVLEKGGHQVQIWDQQVDDRQPADFLRDFDPQLVGFSVSVGGIIYEAIDQSREFKRINPDIKIVWGNVHPSMLTEQTLAEDYVDFVAIGPGEYTLLELAEHLEKSQPPHLTDIKGLAFKENGQVVINPDRPFIKNLDELPDPSWHLVPMDDYWEKSLNTSRGCPSKCIFCYNPPFHKGQLGEFSADRIVGQMEILKGRYDVTLFRFFEDDFCHNRPRLHRFCQLVIDKKMKIRWDCDARAGLTEEDVRLMKQSGCASVGFGVESGSPRLLKFIRKTARLEDIKETFKLLVKYKILPKLYLISELPTETIEDFEATKQLIRELGNPPYQYVSFLPYPGTELYNYCVQRGLEPPKTTEEWAAFISQPDCGIKWGEVPREMTAEFKRKLVKYYFWRRTSFALRHGMFAFYLPVNMSPKEILRVIRFWWRYYVTRPLHG
ncbi:radical SAM protein [Dehalogenimonas sp. THU2]|uniref:B12-binding domain-containing radical SAM protein n=1 Tax=Dehalogenimonas sp. THU2 TaxID=3151121 RepID=UPI00321B0471